MTLNQDELALGQLSRQSIALLCLGDRPMIDPFNAERVVINGKSAGLSAASYDVRIDHDLVLGINPAHIMASYFMRYGKDAGGHFDELAAELEKNPPMAALAYTLEDFWMPSNVSGAVCDKSTYARVFVSAFNTFFDPGFHGNGTLELVNLGTERIIYKQGDPVCQFIFHWLDQPTNKPYDGKYQHQRKGAQGPIYEPSQRAEELMQLNAFSTKGFLASGLSPEDVEKVRKRGFD